MDLQPARVEQVRQTEDGDWVTISADCNSVAADLQKIDKDLKVRFSKRGFFVVYRETKNPDGSVTHDWVLTQQAHQNRFGVWEGLDNRILHRIHRIDGHGRGGYDYVADVEKQNAQAREQARKDFAEKTGPINEKALWAARKDLGATNRAFISSTPLAQRKRDAREKNKAAKASRRRNRAV